MKLSDMEKKFVMLALDAGASDGEIAACASKLIHSFRKRYKSGVELIKDIELDAWNEPQRPMPAGGFDPGFNPFGGVSFTRPFGQAPPNPHQPRQQQTRPPPPRDFNDEWQEILRKAQEAAAASQRQAYATHAAAFAARQQAAFAAQQQANAHAETKEHQDWAKEQLKVRKGLLKKIFEGLI